MIFVYSQRSAESFIELTKNIHSMGWWRLKSYVYKWKSFKVFKQSGWKKLEVFNAGDELLKLKNI